MIYYGDEAGMWGAHDPDDRMPMVWADLEFAPQTLDPRGRPRTADEVKFDQELFDYYRRAISLRREHHALNHGDYATVLADDAQGSLVVRRQSEQETLFIALNRSEKESTLEIGPIPGRLQVLFTSDNPTGVRVEQMEKGSRLVLPPLTGVVLSSTSE